MRVLTLYIAKEVLKGSFVALLFLLTLFDLFTFSDELKDISAGYGLKQIISYVALTSPSVFYELVPASALLGSLFILGAMGNNRELIAMRAAGLSVFGIIRAVMIAGSVLVIISLLVGEFVAPVTQKMAQTLRLSAQNEQIHINAKYGLWLREGNLFINVRQVIDDGHLADLRIYEVDGSHLRRVQHADQAVFIGDHQWRMDHIEQSDISTRQTKASSLDSQLWTSTIAPNLLKIIAVTPNNLSLYDLADYVSFLKQNHQESHTFELALWGRIVNPLVTFIMLLLSTPFVIGVKRGVSVGERMMVGIVIGMSFNIIDKIIGHLGLIYNLSPPLMAFMPSLIVLTLTVFAVMRLQE